MSAKPDTAQLLLGAHLSIAGGPDQALERAKALGCSVLQIFLKNARAWQAQPLGSETVARFLSKQREYQILTVAHASYLINLAASPARELRAKSISLLAAELKRAALLALPYYIVHPGSCGANAEQEPQGTFINLVGEALDRAREQSGNVNTTILLETTAGLKNKQGLGSRFEHLRDIMGRSQYRELLAVCFDTCHVFAAGYDLRKYEAYLATMTNFDKIIGLANLKFFHLNDSKYECGSGLDRHAHIGKGALGEAAFRYILHDERFTAIGKCIETPKGKDDTWDRMNLETLRAFAAHKS